MPPRGADDAELELARGHSLDDEWVSETVRNTRTSGFWRWNSPSTTGTTTAAGPVEAPSTRSPARSPSADAATSADELILEREHPLRPAVEPPACLGRLDAPARAVEELRPEPLLERAYLQRDGRLRDAEPVRRLREAAPLDDGAKRGQLTRVHKRSLSL